jgi:hypothetical protein
MTFYIKLNIFYCGINLFAGMIAMPQPTVQYIQLGQTPNIAHPIIQYNGKLTLCSFKTVFLSEKYGWWS